MKKKFLHKNQFSNKKLSTKLAVVLSVVVFISLFLLLSSATRESSKFLSKTVNDEIMEKANNNRMIVQNLLDNAAVIAQDLESYLENAYSVEPLQTKAEKNSKKQSRIYNKSISAFSEEIENYILNTA